MTARLTQARVQQLIAEISNAARASRRMDPDTKGRISYSAMCGGLQAVLRGLVEDTAGDAAAKQVDAALTAEFDDETEDARAAIAKATGSPA